MEQRHIHTQILIVGGGLVGMAAACAMDASGASCLAVERAPAPALHDSVPEDAHKEDARTGAVAYGASRFLDDIGVWKHLAPYAGEIRHIRASEAGTRAFLHYDAALCGDAPMGYMLPNAAALAGLRARMAEASRLTTLYDTEIIALEHMPDGRIMARTATGIEITADMALISDGRRSALRDMLGISARHHDYRQTAIICTIEHEAPHEKTALELFLPEGPFAALPMRDACVSGIVWTVKNDDAPLYLALSDDEFIAELNKRAHDYLGGVARVYRKASYPLFLAHAKRYVEGNALLIGDAAHGIHPLAGQGFNLGLRGVQLLHDMVKTRIRTGLPLADAQEFSRFEALRRRDARELITVTHGLNALFASRLPAVRFARRAGMAALEHFSPAKKYFIRRAAKG